MYGEPGGRGRKKCKKFFVNSVSCKYYLILTVTKYCYPNITQLYIFQKKIENVLMILQNHCCNLSASHYIWKLWRLLSNLQAFRLIQQLLSRHICHSINKKQYWAKNTALWNTRNIIHLMRHETNGRSRLVSLFYRLPIGGFRIWV